MNRKNSFFEPDEVSDDSKEIAYMVKCLGAILVRVTVVVFILSILFKVIVKYYGL